MDETDGAHGEGLAFSWDPAWPELTVGVHEEGVGATTGAAVTSARRAVGEPLDAPRQAMPTLDLARESMPTLRDDDPLRHDLPGLDLEWDASAEAGA